MDNPFVFDRPNNIETNDFINFYIKDNTYTRFLESSRNIFLIGVRGSGKTSTLRYYSFPIQLENEEVDDKFKIIGIHIPNNHPLLIKKEFLLYERDYKKSVFVEHLMCINLISSICDTFIKTSNSLEIDKEKEQEIIENLSFIFDAELPKRQLFESIKLYLNKESINSQKRLNAESFESFVNFSFTFQNTVIPLLEQIRNIPKLEKSHFSLFFDDLQDFDEIHKRIINSWISYRDNQLFSIKVATADIKPSFITLSGGTILEGHDFIKIDLARRIFNKSSEFSAFAKDVIRRRLDLVGIETEVDSFIPTSPSFQKGLDEGREKAREIAHKKFPNPTGTQISDFISKQGRATYFREKNPKSNKPYYSGFETLVDISTGVIRNLLTPLYYMYDKQLSNLKANEINYLPYSVQKQIIEKISLNFWEKINQIDTIVDKCTDKQALAISNFFNQLAIYLRKRLLDPTISEPRALNFIISQKSEDSKENIDELIEICLKSTLLYKRMVSDKKTGEKLPLYVPNRLMLPAHGLDPHGQYSHFAIPAKTFMQAAYQNIEIPLFSEDDDSQLQIEFN